MCFWEMKMLGTVVWPVISPSVDWIAEPSSVARASVSPRTVPRFVERQCLVIRTNLVELDGVELCAAVAQKLLGLAAVWAVRLGEDGDGVLVDDGLDLGLCGGHGGG